MDDKDSVLKELRRIPGIGRHMAVELYGLGIRSIDGLKGMDPEALYLRLCRERGRRLDRCVLYVFRCAVYFASHKTHDPELLKWWNWKG